MKHIKNYWLVWLLNIIAIILYIKFFNINYKNLTVVALSEIITILGLYYKNSYDTGINDILKINNGNIIVTGIFRNIKLAKANVERIEIRKDYISKLFDWSEVLITTKDGKIKIHTKEVKQPFTILDK